MRISTKGRYAVDIMLDMAMNDTGEYIAIKSIAERQELSVKYLEQIISVLNKAGLVKSIRGSQGGYKLTKTPEHYTLGLILRLLEGTMAPVTCCKDNAGGCPKQQSCVTLRAWKYLDDEINAVFDRITLADLIAWQLENDERSVKE